MIIGMPAATLLNALLKQYLTFMHVHCLPANMPIAVKQSPVFDKMCLCLFS